MTQYLHRMSLVVPEGFINQANQLALFAGESAADVNTFSTANYQDSLGNKYAVCSTVIKPVVLQMFGQPVTTSAEKPSMDTTLAQQALDAAVMYEAGMSAATTQILIGVDIKPHEFFEAVGLTAIETNAEPTTEPTAI